MGDGPNLGSTVTLVPYSGIQFLTYEFNLDEVSRFTRTFVWRETPGRQDENTKQLNLIPGSDEINPDGSPTVVPSSGDITIDVSKARALVPFVDQWMPLPYFAVVGGDGNGTFKRGPSNWVRVKVSEVSDEENRSDITHRAVFAFDTELLERTGELYVAPSEEDAKERQTFRLATKIADIGWVLSPPRKDVAKGSFLENQEWVSRWVEESYIQFQRREALKSGRPIRLEENYPLECVSRYLAFVALLNEATTPPQVHFIDTISRSSKSQTVLVDLVLDIGNSRTCGILIENFPNEKRGDIANSHVLQLRDLGEPHRIYTEPFESHVVLAHADFGPEQLSRMSGNGRRFFWPSPVRIGPEVSRILVGSTGNEFSSGLSSPKRYLWDFEPVLQEWQFLHSDTYKEADPPRILRALKRFVNARGDVIREFESQSNFYRSFTTRSRKIELEKGTRGGLTFARSSFYTFMFVEILVQAMSQINNPEYRSKCKFQDMPRRLRRVILTLPTALPVREQWIMRSRATAAIKLLEEMTKYGREGQVTDMESPTVQITWDEASGVQFVYLYNQISHKFGGNVGDLVALLGRPRVFAESDKVPESNDAPEPSLRIASVDVGGGTTDLMVTTYYVEDDVALKPIQVFRESFRLAGDDILQSVIQHIILPSLQTSLENAGVRSARELLLERFGGDRADMAEQDRHLRRQFVRQILEPIALAVLSAYEGSENQRPAIVTSTIGQFIKQGGYPPPALNVKDYIQIGARESGAPDFDLEECAIEFEIERARDSIMAVLSSAFDNIAEAVHHFDPDVVLLSGRPSRLPGTVDLFTNKLAVPPHRVVPLHKYVVGPWYPFRKSNNIFISDPKTAAVVGAMLCTYAQGHKIPNMAIDTSRFRMRSTAKYIGRLENGRLREKDVLFTDSGEGGSEEVKELRYHAPIFLGYRQLPFERWTASRLYRLQLESGETTQNFKLPIRVTLRREKPEEYTPDESEPETVALRNYVINEAMKEELTIEDAEAVNGPAKAYIHLSLETISTTEDGYWLDTGILFLS